MNRKDKSYQKFLRRLENKNKEHLEKLGKIIIK